MLTVIGALMTGFYSLLSPSHTTDIRESLSLPHIHFKIKHDYMSLLELLL